MNGLKIRITQIRRKNRNLEHLEITNSFYKREAHCGGHSRGGNAESSGFSRLPGVLARELGLYTSAKWINKMVCKLNYTILAEITAE